MIAIFEGFQKLSVFTLHVVSLQLLSIETNSCTLLPLQISDVLDFSKIEAGTLELEAAPFSIRQCLEEAADLVAARAADKGLQLATHTHATIPPIVIGDVSRLRQVLVRNSRRPLSLLSLHQRRDFNAPQLAIHVTVPASIILNESMWRQFLMRNFQICFRLQPALELRLEGCGCPSIPSLAGNIAGLHRLGFKSSRFLPVCCQFD